MQFHVYKKHQIFLMNLYVVLPPDGTSSELTFNEGGLIDGLEARCDEREPSFNDFILFSTSRKTVDTSE